MKGPKPYVQAGIVVLIAAIMVASSLGVAASLTTHAGLPTAAPTSQTAGASSSVTTSGASTGGAALPANSITTSNETTLVVPSQARAEAISSLEQQILASGGNLNTFYPPSINVPTQNPANTGGHVVPLYTNAPAPMGIGTYGLKNVDGVTVPYVLNTKSVEGTFTTSDPWGTQYLDYGGGAGSGWGAQLNVVETNVTIKGNTAFNGNTNQYWLQNVIGYSGTSLSFDENIWNFSYNNQGTLPWSGFSEFPSATILHGGGSVSSSELYEKSGASITISPPFTVNLYLNTTVASYSGSQKVDEVYMNYSVYNSLGQHVCPSGETNTPNSALEACGSLGATYDNVYFNSVTAVNKTTAQIQANGYHYASNGGGTNMDMEFDWGIGSSSAYTTHTAYVNGKMDLLTLNATTGKYQTVPSAYDFGSETGEDTIGSYGTWSTQANGAPIEQLRTGPSVLTGLWNASLSPTAGTSAAASVPGAYSLNYANVEPENAWVAIAQGGGVTDQKLFQVAPTFGWFNRPTSGGQLGPNMWLQPGVYTVEVMLSGFNTFTETISLLNANATLNVALTPNLASTTYTPIYLFSNSEIAQDSSSGNGTAGNPYILVGTQQGTASITAVFGDLSQWPFENWEGVYVNATTAYTKWAPFPTLSITYPWWEAWFLSTTADGPTPLVNHLQIYLYHTQNLAITGATNISGWFASAGANGYTLIATDVQDVILAGNHINNSAEGIEFTGGGTHNYVYDNIWYPTVRASTGAFAPSGGLTVSESGDHIYDNEFFNNATTTVSSASGDTDFWNVTTQAGSPLGTAPASYTLSIDGVTLGGSNILGQNYQGGNYWFNYGLHQDPYGLIPYTDRQSTYTATGNIAHAGAGDFAPLTVYGRIGAGLYPVTVTESGAATGGNAIPAWAVRLVNVPVYSPLTGLTTLVQNVLNATSTLTATYWAPNGTFNYALYTNPAGRYVAATTGSGIVSGGSTGFTVTFLFAYAVTFTESGIVAPATVRWYLNVTGHASVTSTTTTVSITLPNATYQYALGTGDNASKTTSATGNFSVAGATVARSVTYTVVSFAATFTETGLPASTKWYVNVTGQSSQNSVTSTIALNLVNGSYVYATPGVAAKGYVTSAGTFSVHNASVGIPITFSAAPPTPTTYSASFIETGLALAPAGFAWIVGVTGQTTVTSTTATVAFNLANGTYNFTIGSKYTPANTGGLPYTGYFPSPAKGTITVAGTTVSQAITFSETTYPAVFTETGLPGGTNWSVSVYNGASYGKLIGYTSTEYSTTNSITFQLTNSTTGYALGNVPGYTTTASGSFLLNGYGVNVPITFTPTHGGNSNSLTFTETGLSPGTAWALTVNGAVHGSTGSSLTFPTANGSFSYSVSTVPGMTASPTSGPVTVQGTTLSANIAFTTTGYAVTFTEVGLASGTSWSVTVNSVPETSTTNAITFVEAPGTYNYLIAAIAGSAASPSSGSVTVTNAALSVPVSFTTTTYSVSFTPAGAYSGAWAVQFGGVLRAAASGPITFVVPNGTYSYSVGAVSGYTSATTGGPTTPVTVAGAGAAVTITFTAVPAATFNLQFTENGLPSGTSWSATVTGVGTMASTGTTITFTGLAAGVYPYSFGAVAGYTTPAGSSATVSTSSVSIATTYAAPTFAVTFTESGLPAGTFWAVAFAGQIGTSQSTTIVFHVTAGTWNYAVSNTIGYAPSPATGSLVVSGAMGQSVTYTLIPSAPALEPVFGLAAVNGRSD